MLFTVYLIYISNLKFIVDDIRLILINLFK